MWPCPAVILPVKESILETELTEKAWILPDADTADPVIAPVTFKEPVTVVLRAMPKVVPSSVKPLFTNCPLLESHLVNTLLVNEPAFFNWTSLALTVMPVPAPTLKTPLAAVKPSPAAKVP